MAITINVEGNLNLKVNTPKTNLNVETHGEKVKAEVIADNSNFNFHEADVDDTIILGDNNNIESNGDLDLTFWGNNTTIKATGEKANIQTLDNALQNKEWSEYADQIDIDTKVEKDVEVSNAVVTDKSLFNKLSATERKIAESLDWSKKTKSGAPQYMINKAPSGEYHVYSYSYGTRYDAMQGGLQHKDQSFNWNGQKSVFGTLGTTQDEKITTTTTRTFENIKNTTLIFGNGEYNANVSTDKDSLKVIDPNDKANINVTESPVTTVTTETHKDKKGSLNVYTGGVSKWNSPLIIDFNRDGIVSAKSGLGVDVDNDGTADGAATNGDKMLAMTDINGNNQIDGTEVFGNNTINPFTKEKINAPNGFEALKQIAISAEEHTGIKIINGSDVDVNKLNEALNSIGISLGLISGTNVTDIEDLGDLKSINVGNYIENENASEETTDKNVEHRQLGSGTFEDGTTTSVNDVWFASFFSSSMPYKLNQLYTRNIF